MKNVLLFFGGVSCEHDVSIITGVMASNILRGSDYNPIPIYVTHSGEWYFSERLFSINLYKNIDLKKLKKVTLLPYEPILYELKRGKIKKLFDIDAAINCLHGLNGEDGSLAGVLQLSSIPLASPPTFASAVSMDKYYTKIMLAGLGVAFLPYVRLCRDTYERNREFALKFVKRKLDYPVIVKPANLGSSIGISVVESDKNMLPALDNAFRYDGKVIVEKALSNFREINCACYKSGDRYFVSECEEPVLGGKILSFIDKYGNDGKKIFPAKLDVKISDKIKDTVKYIYRKLDFKGVIRVDFLLSEDKIYVNEINSVPGSLAYYLFSDDSGKFQDMLGVLIEDAIDEFLRFKGNEFSFGSGVLDVGDSIKHK